MPSDGITNLSNHAHLYVSERPSEEDQVEKIDDPASTATENVMQPPPEEDGDQAKSLFNILELYANATPEMLERGVKKGVQVLASLKKILGAHDSEENQQWLQSITNVEKEAVQTKPLWAW